MQDESKRKSGWMYKGWMDGWMDEIYHFETSYPGKSIAAICGVIEMLIFTQLLCNSNWHFVHEITESDIFVLKLWDIS